MGERSDRADRVVRPVGEGERVSEAVVAAVGEATGASPGDVDDLLEFDPLSDAVDTDALDALFRDGTDGRLVFQYADCEVVVDRGIRVIVTPLP
jgi:hypothetical protein